MKNERFHFGGRGSEGPLSFLLNVEIYIEKIILETPIIYKNNTKAPNKNSFQRNLFNKFSNSHEKYDDFAHRRRGRGDQEYRPKSSPKGRKA